MENSKQNIMDENPVIIEERTMTADGNIVIKKYAKGRFLGKGGFAKCYEVTDIDTNKIFAAKIIDKGTLSKDRARQKVRI
jgi:polo-like kinase 1